MVNRRTARANRTGDVSKFKFFFPIEIGKQDLIVKINQAWFPLKHQLQRGAERFKFNTLSIYGAIQYIRLRQPAQNYHYDINYLTTSSVLSNNRICADNLCISFYKIDLNYPTSSRNAVIKTFKNNTFTVLPVSIKFWSDLGMVQISCWCISMCFAYKSLSKYGLYDIPLPERIMLFASGLINKNKFISKIKCIFLKNPKKKP